MKELVENMVYLTALKLLVELSNFMEEVKYYLKAQLEKISYVDRRMHVLVDSMRRVEALDLASASRRRVGSAVNIVSAVRVQY